MQARRSHRPLLRRVALTAALAALLPAGVAEAKKAPAKPVVTSVRPMQANIGDTITIYGRNFLKGKSRNTIAFRRDGAKTIFVKADVATLRQIRVQLPETLAPFLEGAGSAPTFTRFRIRVLSKRFGKSFTAVSKSPRIGPAPAAPGAPGAPAAPGAPGAPATPAAPVVPSGNDDCDEDGILNKNDEDDDNDLLTDALEKELMTDACAKDSDGDGVEDGFEYKSAIDLNDDEYQHPNKALPFPGAKPYPNPLFDDARGDFDHDGLAQSVEQDLWKYAYSKSKVSTRTLFPLSYSDGMQYSVHGVCKASGNPAGSPCANDPNSEGRRYPTLTAAGYERWFGPDGFVTWLKNNSYEYVVLGWDPVSEQAGTRYHILDFNRSGTLTDGGYNTPGIVDYPDSEDRVDAGETQIENRAKDFLGSELYAFAYGGGKYIDDADRDEDADGLTNIQELRGSMTRGYWEKCYGEVPFPADPGQGTHPVSPFDPDSDGDGVRDGADDEDHDDLPNIMEMSRMAASGFNDNDDGSTPPQVAEGEAAPQPTTGGAETCTLDKELPPRGEEGEPKPMWHGPSYSWARVNPFNPCLPSTESRTCPNGTPFGVTPAPFGEAPRAHHQWFSLQ